MDAQRVHGWVLLLSAATLPIGGCAPQTEAPEQDGPGSGETSAESDKGAPPSEASVCERIGARYVECYDTWAKSAEEAAQWCEEWIEYLGDISPECVDTYVTWADCASALDCAEFETGCVEELTAYAALRCMDE